MESLVKRSVQTLAIPVSVFVILNLLCSMRGTSLFQTGDSLLIFTRGVASVMITTLALSINLSSGRFDFSIGSIATLSSVLSSMICIRIGAGAGAMLALSLCFGALLGLISGALYVSLGISPIICSLGVALLYEGISFAATGGANVSFVLNVALISFSKGPLNMLIIILAVLIISIYLFDFTKFGYDYAALKGGQKVAVGTGIKEARNALICYTLTGMLMSIVGFITASQMGYIEAGKLNFGTIGVMFTAFLPMFIGDFIGRFSNNKIGYLLGAVCTTLIGMAYSALNASTSTQSIITASLLVLFLIYLNNERRIRGILTLDRRRKESVGEKT